MTASMLPLLVQPLCGCTAELPQARRCCHYWVVLKRRARNTLHDAE